MSYFFKLNCELQEVPICNECRIKGGQTSESFLNVNQVVTKITPPAFEKSLQTVQPDAVTARYMRLVHFRFLFVCFKILRIRGWSCRPK